MATNDTHTAAYTGVAYRDGHTSAASMVPANVGLPYRHNHRGQALAAVTGLCLALTTILMVLRFCAIRVQRRQLYPDDYFAVVAWMCSTALGGCTIWAVANGLGGYSYQLDHNQLVVQAKLVFSSYFTWTFGTCFSKLAVLGLCSRIFSTRRFRIAAYVLMGGCVVYVIIFFPIFMSGCTPPQAAWEPSKGHCRTIDSEEYASVSLNIILDLAVVLLPMWATWGLQLPWRKKLGVMLLFSIGMAVIGIMAWRIEDTWRYASGREPDGIWHEWNISMQSGLEIWLGLIAACLPTIPPLFSRKVNPRFARWGANHGLWSSISRHSSGRYGTKLSG